jgi:hypothetical protein
MYNAGADADLKKIAPNGGRHNFLGGISCEKSRLYAKNHIPNFYLTL